MKLQRAARNGVSPCRVICKRCAMLGKNAWHWEVNSYADLDDAPGSYYCLDCTRDIAPTQTIDIPEELT